MLQDVNLSIRAGETVALVGPSGAGKTTLCSLPPRFYDTAAGRITIDGIDIRDMTPQSLRSHIGIVQQDVFLFDGSIRENIAYGRLDAADSDIMKAVSRAQLEDLVASLPDGLDTLIGERGVKLSGGQKQRLSIARCSSRIRRFLFWTKQRLHWMRRPKRRFSRRWPNCRRTYDPGDCTPTSNDQKCRSHCGCCRQRYRRTRYP